VDALWDPHLRTGRVQLVVQTRPGKVRLALPPVHDGVRPIVYAPVGLPRESYVDLVRQADVGLLLYDAERYYTRCSGVLLEMLCTGVSVIVPAGSWLAEQIAEPIQLHRDGLAETSGPQLPVAGRTSFGSRPARFDVEIPPNTRGLLVSCTASEPLGPGVYVRLDARQLDERGGPLGSCTEVLGPREPGRPMRALLRLTEGARRLDLGLRNAFGEASVALEHVVATPLPQSSDVPAGAIGCIAAEPAAAPALVREVIEHHEHYRRTCASFAPTFRARHDAADVLRLLLSPRSA
jgi:hypothetical protein